MKKDLLPFDEAREFARNLKFKSSSEWQEWRKSGDRPKNIPSSPDQTYKGKGWTDWPDFLGYEKVEWLSFEEARDFARNLNLKSQTEWCKWSKSGMRPQNIPSAPNETYKDKGWTNWFDFLGYEKVEFLSFEKSREFARNLNFKSTLEWQEWSKSGMRPQNIPGNPNETYKDKGWKGWGDFLGNEFITFEEAREFARNLNFKSKTEWQEWCKSGMRPENIPSKPETVYKEKGWTNWNDFLGTIGTGNHIWTKPVMLFYLKEIYGFLHTCNVIQLISIIQANGLYHRLPSEFIQSIQNTNPSSLERSEVILDLISQLEASPYDSGDLDDLFAIQGSSISDESIIDDISIMNTLDSIYTSQIDEINQLGFLLSLENRKVTASLDKEMVDFLVFETINNLWYSILNKKLTIEKIKELQLKEEIPQRITSLFLAEYYEIVNMKLPEGWIYPHQPHLMQKLVSYRVSQKKRYGNWSSVGSGKTLSAILATRVVNAKNVLVISFNSTISEKNSHGWRKEIETSFENTKVWTKRDKDISFDNDYYNYFLVNYETFQQQNADDFVEDLLKKGKIDFIILDEAHNMKRRDYSESKRRGTILDLIHKVRESNPNYYLLVMTATPVINNLVEGESLIEIIEGDGYKTIALREDIQGCVNLYRRLTNYGIRYKNLEHKILKGDSYTILDIKADELYNDALLIQNDDFLKKDQLVLDSKLDAILPYVNTSKGKTIIYTSLVREIEDRTYEYLIEKGFKVGIYTGRTSLKEREQVLYDFIQGDIDVIVSSQPIATGTDGLQKISDRIIILSLPLTHSLFIQLCGRVDRQGSNFAETGVDIIIPFVSISGYGGTFRWDYQKYNLINHKKTISNAVLDGIIPENIIISKGKLIEKADESMISLMERIEKEIEKENTEIK